MRSGKVTGTDLSGRGKKVYHKGDTVNEQNFPPGNYVKLVASGWIDEGNTVEVVIEKVVEVELEEPNELDSEKPLDLDTDFFSGKKSSKHKGKK